MRCSPDYVIPRREMVQVGDQRAGQECLCLKRGKSINFVPCLILYVFSRAIELASRLPFKAGSRVQNVASFIGSHVYDISDMAREEKG